MAKKRKIEVDGGSEGAFHQPFAGLAELRDELASKESPGEAPAPSGPPTDGASGENEEGLGHKVVLRREKKGRGGKTVTRVCGLGLDAAALSKLAKELKRALGCGATVEDRDILLQGDQTERGAAFFERRGVKKVVIGN